MKKSGLRRELGLLHATMMGIGGAICAGIFVLIGYATSMAGNAVVIAFLIVGIINLFTMCSYAELGASMPKAAYAKAAFGGVIAFITGWFEWLSNMFYAALSSVGFAYIITYMISGFTPTENPVAIPVIAIIMVAIFTLINIRGVKEVGSAQVIMIAILLAILLAYIVGGLQHIQGMNEFQLSMPKGLWGVIGASAYLFVVYLGAGAIAVSQAEIKEPSKTIPRAILLSAGVLIAVYTFIAYVTVRIVPPETLAGQTAPMTFAAEQLMGKWGLILFTVAGSIAALSSLNTSIMAQSRVAYALSMEGYFPKVLSKIHERSGTPHVAVIFGSIFTGILAATGIVEFVGYATNFGFIIGFTLVNLSLIRLRKKEPYLKRPFKTPLYPFTPIAGIITSLMLLMFIEPSVLMLGAELGILAFLAYYVIMMGYSRIRIAFGGMNFGIGSLGMLLAYLIKSNLVSLPGIFSQWTNMLFYGLIFISAVYILAGILNITIKS